MKWRRVDKWHLESEDMRWTITKCLVCGVPVYQLWKGKELRHTSKSAEECKAKYGELA